MTPIDMSTTGNSTPADGPDSTSDQPQDLHTTFVAKNITLLQSLQAGDRLIEACSSLPEMKQYILKWEDATAGEGTCFPASTSEAVAHRPTFARLADVIDVTGRALSMPVLEPRPSVKVDQDCDGVSVGVRVGRHDPEHCQLVRNDAVGVK